VQANPQTVEAGQEVTWQATLRNNGNDNLRSVVVRHQRTLLEEPFDLKAGHSRDFTFTTNPKNKGEKTESVTASGLASNGQKVQDEAGTTIQVKAPPPPPKPQPGLTLSLAAQPKTVEAGREVRWTCHVKNSGNEALRGVTVQHGRTLLADPYAFAAGETQTFTFTTTPQSQGQKTEKVAVTALAGNDRSLRDEAEATIQVRQPSPPPEAKPQPVAQRPAKAQAKSLPKTLTLTTPVKMEFVLVPAGEFLMGSDPAQDKDAQKYEQPQHTLTLSDYYIGKYPVTNAQYAAFVKATGHEADDQWKKGKFPAGGERHPAIYVSWQDAVAFCRWLSQESGYTVRLPTEAEWEKAARGTEGRIYPWGNQPPTAVLCNFAFKVGVTTPVGKY
jgi:formylglycine-generating enzyme required for sulfatase activity